MAEVLLCFDGGLRILEKFRGEFRFGNREGDQSARFCLQLQMTTTMLAGHLVTDVFQPRTDLLLTMRTTHVGGSNIHRRVIRKRMLAVLALDPESLVLTVNSQFLQTSGTTDVVTARGG